MKLFKIKDIGKVVSGSTPKSDNRDFWNGDIIWATPKDISVLDTPYLSNTDRKITEKGLKSCSTTLLPRGSILFTSRAPIGHIAIANVEVCTNQGFKSIILNEGFYPLYIYYVLKYNSARLDFLGTGTTFRELSKSTFENFEIPVPSLNVQKKIADLLFKSEELILDRRTTIKLIDELSRSTFLKKFGDPIFNEKNLAKSTLGSVCNITKLAGYEYTKYVKYTDSGDVIAVRGLNVKKGQIKLENLKYIDQATSDYLVRSKLNKGDIAMTYVGANIGDVAIIKESNKFHLAPNVCKLTSKDDEFLLPSYLLHYLIISKSRFSRFTTNTAKQSLNMSSIRKVDILIPDRNLQIQFDNEITVINNLKEFYEHSLSVSVHAYNSFLERVFIAGKNSFNLNKVNFRSNSKIDFHGREVNISAVRKLITNIEIKPKKLKNKTNKLKNVSTENSNALSWSKVSIEQVANWMKRHFGSNLFNSEMLIQFLRQKHLLSPNYFSSEELKKNPQLHITDDLKSFIFSALENENKFIRLEQIFYDGNEENLEFNMDKNKLLENKSIKERSGIYFKIVE